MASNIIDEVFVYFGIQSDGIGKDLNEIENKLTGGFARIASKVVAPIAAMFTAQALGSMFNDITREADAVGKTADRMGVAVEELHAWQGAAKLSGGNADSLNSSISTLSKNLSEMALKGNSSITPFLQSLGVDALDSSKKARNAFDVLMDISKAVEGKSKQESAGMLQAMGFDQGTIQLLQSGTRNIKELIRQQKELGVYTKEDAAAAAAYNNALEKLSRTLKSSIIPIVTKVAQVSTQVIDAISDGVHFLREHIRAFIPAIIGLSVAFAVKLAPAITAVTINFAKMALAFLASPIGIATMALLALGVALDDLLGWMNGEESAFGEFWEYLFGPAEDAKAAFEDFLSYIQPFGEIIKGVFSSLFSSITGYFKSSWSTFVTGLKTIGSWISFVVSVLEVLYNAIFGTSEETSASVDKMLGKWLKFKDNAISYLEEVKNTLQSLLNVYDTAKEGIGKIAAFFSADDKGSEAAVTGGGAKTVGDFRKIDNNMNQQVTIYANGDPNAIGSAVAGATKKGYNDVTNPSNTPIFGM